jgi:hypothetical protein
MFLGAYHFDGDPELLLPSYDLLRHGYPPGGLDLHVCLITAEGITVYDACPTEADFTAFSTGPEFAAGLGGVGLPVPRIEALGEVYAAEMRQGVTR